MQYRVQVKGAGTSVVNGYYNQRAADVIPEGFDATCRKMGWETAKMWQQLTDGRTPWFEKPDGAYIYLNTDGQWWIDGPSGAGVYIAPAATDHVPPRRGYRALPGAKQPVPAVVIEEAPTATTIQSNHSEF